MTVEYLVTLLVGLAGGFFAPLVLELVRRQKTKTEAELNIAQSASEIAEGGEKAVAAVTKLLEIYEKRDADKTKEIDNLRAQITAMQIDERARSAQQDAKITALEGYVGLLVDVLRKNNIDIPPRPDILKESSPKIRPVK